MVVNIIIEHHLVYRSKIPSITSFTISSVSFIPSDMCQSQIVQHATNQ
jgi:hypothetical protein